MSRGKQGEPFEGARRSGEVDETLKFTHKLEAVDEGDAIETVKGFPAVDWSIDDDLAIQLPGAVAPVLAVTPEIELDHKDLVGYKVELEDKDVIGLEDQVGSGLNLVDDVGIIGPIDDVAMWKFDGLADDVGIIGPIDDVAMWKFDGLADDVGIIGPLDDVGIIGPLDDVAIKFDGVDGESTSVDYKGEIAFDVKIETDFDAAPVFEEFDAQWSAGVGTAPLDMSPELDGLVELADPIDLQGFDG